MLMHMKPDSKHMAFVAGTALAVFLLLVSGPGRAGPTDEVDETIQYLIKSVSGSSLTFFRNGSSYTPSEAAEHMNRKYQHFREEIDTPEEFIELCATKSLLTGKPYLVVDGQGKERRTSDWLRAKLAAYQERNR
jgi:hypothetical protein